MTDPWSELLAAAREFHAEHGHVRRCRLCVALEAFPEQPSLFDPLPPEPTLGLDENALGGFRASDPKTSRDGAVYVFPRTSNQRHRIFEMAVRAGDRGVCTFEVTERTGIVHQTASTRISELVKKTLLLESSGRERVSPQGARQVVWVPTALGWAEAYARAMVP